MCRYNSGTSLDKDGIKVLFLEIRVAWLVINFIPPYFPVWKTQLKEAIRMILFQKRTTSSPLRFLSPAHNGAQSASVGQIPPSLIQHMGAISHLWEMDKAGPFPTEASRARLQREHWG